jgi:hypothetical protein
MQRGPSWPRKYRIPVEGGGYLPGTQLAWWHWRKRRRDVRSLNRFDWRPIRVGFRRPAEQRAQNRRSALAQMPQIGHYALASRPARVATFAGEIG